MYILIAAALAFSLFITAAPAHKVSANSNDVISEWSRISPPTPSEDDWVLAPETTIIDYDVAEGGDVAYAIVDGWNAKEAASGYWLLKSENGAATWKDITDVLEKVRNTETISELVLVATDGEDAEFVAVALVENGLLRVFVSKDGGTTFKDAGEVKDVVYFDDADEVYDLAVSPEVAGTRDIAIGGRDNLGAAALFRCTVTAGTAGAWEDATDYDGWDNAGKSTAFTSVTITDIQFPLTWAADKSVLVVTIKDDWETVHLQTGTWGETPGWNWKSIAGIDAVKITTQDLPTLGRLIAGITLPSDYSATTSDKRYAWVWVNYGSSSNPAATIYVVKNNKAETVGPKGQVEGGELWLTNVSYLGSIAEGKAIAGVLGTGSDDWTECCYGVQVYRNDNITHMDICCYGWEEACKLPTGRYAMAAFYVSADKAYAVALYGDGSYDESAWSVSFDDGDVWNQLSLVDTQIDYLSDVAVSPNCNKIMLVSVNVDSGCGCDSVWLKADDLPEAEEYSGKWLRTWCGQLGDEQYGLLRLAPEENNGDTVYLVDRGTGTVYWNEMETFSCWNSGSAVKITNIVDLAVKDKSTIYALGLNGDVAMSDNYARAWHTPVDSKVDSGWTIAVKGDDILVGGQDGDVSYSDDGGETFTALEENPSIDGLVTVAFDSYFDQNNTIYAATATALAGDKNGIYRWVIDESGKWENMGAAPYDCTSYDFTGLVLGFNPGNPKTSADTGGVLYASYIAVNEDGEVVTGVARSLNPAKTIACLSCVEWDYLVQGLTPDAEAFYFMPKALKICGCTDPTTNTKLFAIDGSSYDMEKAKTGTVWTFEDCYAKKAPEVTSPTGNTTIPADACACANAPFNVKWDRLCDACGYEIEFALDEDFTTAMKAIPVTPTGGAPSYLVAGGADGQGLSLETTYYLRIRASKAATGQVIHSWWSDPLKITIAPSTGQAVITLVSPVPGAQEVATKNLGFSWNMLAAADKFDWNLSTNADLSSPVESKTGLTNTAYTCTKTLTYGTTYYWQVTAYNKGATISTSAVGTFTTAPTGAYCCPVDGLCFDTEALLKAHTAAEHPAQPATPFWVWIVIAIGAVLVIVVIVLIFRTRRV